MSSNITIDKVCQECNQSFVAKTTTTKYCSHKCASRAYKKRKWEEKVKNAEIETRKTIAKNKVINFDNREVFSIAETCQIMGICRTTLYLWIKNKTIKSSKVGGRIFISKKEIKGILNL